MVYILNFQTFKLLLYLIIFTNIIKLSNNNIYSYISVTVLQNKIENSMYSFFLTVKPPISFLCAHSLIIK